MYVKVCNRDCQTVWLQAHGKVAVINQEILPHRYDELTLSCSEDAIRVIRDMVVRGAGCIGAVSAWGIYLAACEASDTGWLSHIHDAADRLKATRPTASNLAWAVDRLVGVVGKACSVTEARELACAEAQAVAEEDKDACRQIGLHGLALIRDCWQRTGRPVQILTHCNAGWLAFVDYGSATAPIYAAHAEGIPVHVWVDETRPRNQGARLTAWELGEQGVPHTLIADNAGGHLMQHGLVDMVLTGTDRVTRTGDVANKIGTYLKALAAADNAVPFYVALPSSTFDFALCDGVREIPIEERDDKEVRYIEGVCEDGREREVRICPPGTRAGNWGFDVTPGRLVTGLITERGICEASESGIRRLYPEAIP